MCSRSAAGEKYRERWWDVATGQQRADIAADFPYATLNDQQTIAVLSFTPTRPIDEDEGTLVDFWDLPSGTKRHTWDLATGRPWAWTLHDLRSHPLQPWLALELPRSVPNSRWQKVQEQLAELTNTEHERTQTVLCNDETQTDIAYLPGTHAVFSSNGRWLATSDMAGTIRVWELPFRRPWWLIFDGALLGGLPTALGVRYSYRLVRGPWRLARRLLLGKRTTV